MRIGLIDMDNTGNFPNLALMKISAAHKRAGDSVEWYMPFNDRYDKVYVSKVFSFSPDYDEVINADQVVYGGTGYQIKLINGKEVFSADAWGKKHFSRELPEDWDRIYPDYSLYPRLTYDTAYGFLTRGCPRGCSFCHVAAKEGTRVFQVGELRDFWGGQRNIVLCDPNILAFSKWDKLLIDLIKSKSWINFNQGLDARLMTEGKALLLSKVKMKEVHFAWDRMNDRDKVLRGLELYASYATRKPHGAFGTVYVLVNFDTEFDDDLERISTLRNMGYHAYVMIYDKEHADPIYNKLARWCNNRYIFKTVDKFWDYVC